MSAVEDFKFGRQPAIHPVGYRLLGSYVDALPSAAATFDHTNGFNGFNMLGNGPDPSLTVNGGNPVGDCAFVGTVNCELIDSVETGSPFRIPDSNTVVSNYLTYDHGQDVGANLSQLLALWRGHGLPWGKIAGYAGLNFRDWDEFWAGVNAFGNGYIGIVVTQAMMDQTQAGEPWDLTGTAADDQVLGGHCVVVFCKPESDMGTVATWGMRQQFTQRWFAHNVEEAHCVITPQQLAAKGNGYGLDLARLEHDLTIVEAA